MSGLLIPERPNALALAPAELRSSAPFARESASSTAVETGVPSVAAAWSSWMSASAACRNAAVEAVTSLVRSRHGVVPESAQRLGEDFGPKVKGPNSRSPQDLGQHISPWFAPNFGSQRRSPEWTKARPNVGPTPQRRQRSGSN